MKVKRLTISVSLLTYPHTHGKTSEGGVQKLNTPALRVGKTQWQIAYGDSQNHPSLYARENVRGGVSNFWTSPGYPYVHGENGVEVVSSLSPTRVEKTLKTSKT